jgi:hypothetical protein
MGLSDPFEAYHRAGVLARVCLNVSERDFANLRTPLSFNPWKGRNDWFKQRRDRGYLFLCLLVHGEQFDASDFTGWLDQTLAAANLGMIRHIEQKANETIPKISQSHYKGWATSKYQRAVELGAGQFPVVGLLNSASVIADNVLSRVSSLQLPPVVLGDATLWSPSAYGESASDIEKWVFDIRDVESEMRDFLSACSA